MTLKTYADDLLPPAPLQHKGLPPASGVSATEQLRGRSISQLGVELATGQLAQKVAIATLTELARDYVLFSPGLLYAFVLEGRCENADPNELFYQQCKAECVIFTLTHSRPVFKGLGHLFPGSAYWDYSISLCNKAAWPEYRQFLMETVFLSKDGEYYKPSWQSLNLQDFRVADRSAVTPAVIPTVPFQSVMIQTSRYLYGIDAYVHKGPLRLPLFTSVPHRDFSLHAAASAALLQKDNPLQAADAAVETAFEKPVQAVELELGQHNVTRAKAGLPPLSMQQYLEGVEDVADTDASRDG